MALDVAAFARTRPYAYHLTAATNLASTKRGGQLDSAVELILKDGRKELLRRRRAEHEQVKVDGRWAVLRDQAPLHPGNLTLSGGWSFGDLVEALNGRVFFWPGTEEGPSSYRRRHFGRYLSEGPVLIRVMTSELLRMNHDAVPEFCRYNSGSPRCSGGRPSPRGPDTFATASRFQWPPSEVVELLFRRVAVLPDSWEVGASPDGPWSMMSGRKNLPSNPGLQPTAAGKIMSRRG